MTWNCYCKYHSIWIIESKSSPRIIILRIYCVYFKQFFITSSCFIAIIVTTQISDHHFIYSQENKQNVPNNSRTIKDESISHGDTKKMINLEETFFFIFFFWQYFINSSSFVESLTSVYNTLIRVVTPKLCHYERIRHCEFPRCNIVTRKIPTIL